MFFLFRVDNLYWRNKKSLLCHLELYVRTEALKKKWIQKQKEIIAVKKYVYMY